ncbi:restriction endonuclease subunit S [Candidatus Accumulibacter phosphatis]|nr:restriction endonuclease subunit S [Candidatus Accumulibacter phosphatis]
MTPTTASSLVTAWQTARLKFAAPLRNERTAAGSDTPDYLGLENIESWTGRIIESVPRSANEIEGDAGLANVFRKGDVLFGKLRPYLAKACYAPRDGVCSTELLVMRPAEVLHPPFLLYSVLVPDFVGAVNASTFGAKMPRASWDFIGSLAIGFPKIETQAIIASYLDRETARIDGLIAEKERMLALLEEKRAALISRVVTRGLDPNAPLKPSGQEWLGEIPAHWEEPRAKGLFREVDRRTETGEETLLSLRMGKGLVPHNEVSEKLLEASDVTGFKKIEPGQMVINRMRAASGLIAVATEPGLVSPDYAVFDVADHKLSIEYFLELFKTSLLQAVFRSSSKGLGTGEQGFLHLYTDAFLSLHFPYPPIDEQHAIVAFIQQERSEMLHMESLLLRSIDLAKERRAALITAAVTGQIPLEEMTG